MNYYRVNPPLPRPITLPWLTWLLFGAVLLIAFCARGEAGTNAYDTGCQDVIRIAADLHEALTPKYRRQICPTPVLLEKLSTPYVQPGARLENGAAAGTVEFSSGLVHLFNYLSHAKAIDGGDPGFYSRSITSLAATDGQPGLPALRLNSPSAWSFDTLNRQVSQFNQMAGALIAIEMAHHYLGHYRKYAAQLVDAQNRPVPINSLLTPKEWHSAVMAGAKNALNCGLGVDGLKSLLEGFDKLSPRPAWSIHLLPANANVAKINRELEAFEKDFFLLSDVGR
jgi:hypothetical protein